MKMNKKYILILGLMVTALWLGCQSVLADENSEMTMNDLNVDASKTISMDLKDAKLNDVLKIFSQQSGLNFIASKDVSQVSLNLYLDKVPVQEALERILSANDLTYEIQPGSNVFVVKAVQPTQGLVTRVYPLKYATVPASKINNTFTISPQTSSQQGSSSSSSSSSASTSSANGIVEIIKSLLSTQGKVIEDPRTNSLVITDIPTQFPLIEQTIARLDVRVPEILIEIEMLDVSKNTADLLGAKWGDSPVRFHGGEKDDNFPFNTDNIADDNLSSQNPALDNNAPGTRDALFAQPRYRVSTLSFNGLSFVLQFLRTKTDTRNLARPRILTLNNQMAEIKISANEAIGLSQSTSSSQSTSNTVATAEREPTGVFFSVTPQANLATGEITMALEPRVVQAKTGGTFGGQTFKDVEERGTKSILRINDGDTIMIGGLLRSDISDVRTSVPGISKIPVVGLAFRHKDKTEGERELIVFLTPHIVREEFASNKKINRNEPLVREQDVPQNKLRVVNQNLGSFENQGIR